MINHWILNERAIRYTNGKRIVALECETCGRKWDVSNRGRETGFIVAAADSHATRCKREKQAAQAAFAKEVAL